MQFLGHPSLVVPGQYHNIYTNYMYLCGEVPGVLRDIRITLQPVGKLMGTNSLEYSTCIHSLIHTHPHMQARTLASFQGAEEGEEKERLVHIVCSWG